MIKKSRFFAISLRYDKKTGFFLQFNFIYLFQNGFNLNSTSDYCYRFNFANASAIAELVGVRSLRWGLRSRRS